MKTIFGVVAVLAVAVSLPAYGELVTGEKDGNPINLSISAKESRPSTKGDSQKFTGLVRVQPFFKPNSTSKVSASLVTFERGARSAWHSHPVGQRLVVTSGAGWVQEEGGPIREIQEGDVVWIPKNVKHWHGASTTSTLSHIAIQEAEGGKNVDWLGKVSDEDYLLGSKLTDKK